MQVKNIFKAVESTSGLTACWYNNIKNRASKCKKCAIEAVCRQKKSESGKNDKWNNLMTLRFHLM